MKKANILFIHTPVASPAIPSLNSAMAATCFSSRHLNCFQYDANLDFFLNYVLSKKRLPHYLAMIEKKKSSGIIPERDFPLIKDACQRIDKARVSIDILRTSAFYDPVKLLAAKNHIDDLLLCFSYAFSPYKIGWDSFVGHTDLLNEDPEDNPFILLCKEGLSKRIIKINPDVIVLFVSSSDQVMAGETMAGFIRTNFPGKKTIVINAEINHDIIGSPDFKTLPLKDYLSPVFFDSDVALFFEDYYGHKGLDKGDKIWIESNFQTYKNVTPLPGEPFWKILEDPVYIWLYLNRYKKKVFLRMRADKRQTSVITLGSHIRFYFKKPKDLPDGFMDEICRMVEAGGSVDGKYVRHNLERAYLIGYAMENDIIIGNSSLKHPRKEFIKRISGIGGMDFNHFLERGYTSVRPEYRSLGVGVKLLEGLTARAGDHKVFSIISEDNKVTQKIALRTNTRKIMTYYSEKVGKELGVWMPGQMIEDNWNLTK